MAAGKAKPPGRTKGKLDECDEAWTQALSLDVAELAGEDEDEDDIDVHDGLDVEDHLKGAVEGSLRLKRLLSRDEEEGAPSKRAKAQGAARQLLIKRWNRASDEITKYVVEGLTDSEFIALNNSGWAPNAADDYYCVAEQVHVRVMELRETQLPMKVRYNHIEAFKWRWNIKDTAQDALLKAVDHKTLRYVFQEYDGSLPLGTVIADAEGYEPEDPVATESAIPDEPGLATFARFTRLELIDPLADAAVFGDANLTFGMRLAQHRTSVGHVGRVIATTFEELDTLRERYQEIDSNIKFLRENSAEVYHGVDCTRLAVDPRFQAMAGQLGSVYYNFPHSGAIQHFFDTHPCVNWRHENLMRLFFRALRFFVQPGGSVKVASSAGATGVRYSYIVDAALSNEFQHVETMPFLDWILHRYGRSYGDKRDIYKRPDAKKNESYNAQSKEKDMVYCFMYRPTGKKLGKQHIRLPPTLATLQACKEGPFKSLNAAAREKLAKSLHERFVTEISGTHVG